MTSGGSASAEVPEPDVEAAKTLVGDRAGTKIRLDVTDGCQECKAAASMIVRNLAALGLDVEVVSVPDSYHAIREPKADYDMRIGATWPDLVGAASFLDQVLSTSLPASWLPEAIKGVQDTLRPATGDDREVRARELADGLLAGELPVAVYGYTVRGAYLGPTVGCVEFSPIGTIDLTALCPAP